MSKPRILLLTPPMVQVNTPYPATPYLAGFLKHHGYRVDQADFSLGLALRVFSRAGLDDIARRLRHKRRLSAAARFFLRNLGAYRSAIGPVARLLQNRNDRWIHRILSGKALPEGPRFQPLRAEAGSTGPLNRALARLTPAEQARHLASLYIDDLADVIAADIDPRFALSRYAEKLAIAAPDFGPLRRALERAPTLLDHYLEQLTDRALRRFHPGLVGITVPFPGNLYGALRIARRIRQVRPACRLVLGGGYINTELRQLAEPRIFDYVDFIALDDGYAPMLHILRAIAARTSAPSYCRTMLRVGRRVTYADQAAPATVPFNELPAPDYSGLPIRKYLSLLELPNPMLRLWSDGRWNKLMLAHGCYWRRCAFCDTHLDYIARFEPARASVLVDHMEAVMAQTGENGFHFVDEAAPPALLDNLSREILRRGLKVRWWTNIRFEKTFTPALARRLRQAGCIAVSGGLETVNDRLLARMQKGIRVPDAIRTLRAIAQAGIRVHAYLMYGFPSQTAPETIDALEIVRQLFKAGCLHSAYWHRFALTVHSPVSQNPGAFGLIIPEWPDGKFARNELAFVDAGGGCDPAAWGAGLRKANYNYMHGNCLDLDVRGWFGQKAPRPRVAADYVARLLRRKKGTEG